MDRRKPVVLRGLSQRRTDILIRRGRRTKVHQLKSLKREQLLSILVANGIQHDLVKIKTAKPQLMRLLQQQIAARGVCVEEPPPPAEQVDEGEDVADEEDPPALVAQPLDCASCRDNVSTVIFKLCSHLCLCPHCWDALLQRHAPDADVPCPLCGHLHPQNQVIGVFLV